MLWTQINDFGPKSSFYAFAWGKHEPRCEGISVGDSYIKDPLCGFLYKRISTGDSQIKETIIGVCINP